MNVSREEREGEDSLNSEREGKLDLLILTASIAAAESAPETRYTRRDGGEADRDRLRGMARRTGDSHARDIQSDPSESNPQGDPKFVITLRYIHFQRTQEKSTQHLH